MDGGGDQCWSKSYNDSWGNWQLCVPTGEGWAIAGTPTPHGELAVANADSHGLVKTDGYKIINPPVAPPVQNLRKTKMDGINTPK